MSDLNFFYGFNQEKRARTRLITLILFGILVILGGAGSLVLYLEQDIYREKANVDKYNKTLRTTKGIKFESDLQGISEEERRLKESLSQIQSIKGYVSGLNKITTYGILRIFNSLPEKVNIISFEWNEGQLYMECESFDRKGVASTINNLKGVGFKEVYVPSVVAVENEGVTTTYRFSITGKIQEDNKHEGD